MPLLHLRDRDVPDDAIVMIRAGLNGLSTGKLRSDAARAHLTLGVQGVSVFASLPGETLRAAWRDNPHIRSRPLVWCTTAGAIRKAGFPLLPTGRNERHYTVVLATTDDDRLTALASLFRREDRQDWEVDQ